MRRPSVSSWIAVSSWTFLAAGALACPSSAETPSPSFRLSDSIADTAVTPASSPSYRELPGVLYSLAGEQPTAPGRPLVKAAAHGAVSLRWRPSKARHGRVAGYLVQRKARGRRFHTVAFTTSPSYTDRTARNGSYVYRVLAVDGFGGPSLASNDSKGPTSVASGDDDDDDSEEMVCLRAASPRPQGGRLRTPMPWRVLTTPPPVRAPSAPSSPSWVRWRGWASAFGRDPAPFHAGGHDGRGPPERSLA